MYVPPRRAIPAPARTQPTPLTFKTKNKGKDTAQNQNPQLFWPGLFVETYLHEGHPKSGLETGKSSKSSKHKSGSDSKKSSGRGSSSKTAGQSGHASGSS